MSRVLVTGASGYLGSWLTADLLRAGTEVRATVRSRGRETALRESVRRGGADDAGLEVVVADLLEDDGWATAAAGMSGVYHVATPMIQVTDPEDVIRPAVDGALRALKASRDAGVQRLVLTSSFAAIGYSPKPVRDYDETDWTDPDMPGLPAYPKAKTLAERAAWEFMDAEGGDLEFVSVNPTWIVGPSLTGDARSSLAMVKGMLDGVIPVVPKQRFGVADVRDVSDLHIRAMTTPSAAGKRYLGLADGPTRSFLEVAQLLGAQVAEAPGPVLGTLVIHNERARDELGFRPRPAEDSIRQTGEYLRDTGLLAAQPSP